MSIGRRRRALIDVVQRAGRGTVAGVAVAAPCLVVGLIRAGVYFLSGGHVAAFSPGDVRLVAFYIGGFMLAGALIAAAWPAFRGRTGEYVAFALGGCIVGVAIIFAEPGVRAARASDWVIGVVVGAGLGCAFAYGWRCGPS